MKNVLQWGWLHATYGIDSHSILYDNGRHRWSALAVERCSSAVKCLARKSGEPGFESPFATVSKIGLFRSLYWHSSWFSCINEYLAIDSDGNVSDLVFARNSSIARMLPGEAELVSEWTGLSGRAKRVKRFERSNGPDIALYKNYLYLYTFTLYHVFSIHHLTVNPRPNKPGTLQRISLHKSRWSFSGSVAKCH